MDSVEIKRQMDTLCSEHGPSKLIPRIEELKNSHKYLVSKEYGRFIDQFGVFFDVTNEIILGANYIPKESWPKHRSLQYVLINRNIKFIYSAFDQLIGGFWENSFVLGRPAYEAFLRVLFISLHPEDSDSAMLEQKGKRKFTVVNFIKDELKMDWHDYEFYSILTHSNKYMVLRDYVKISKEGQTEPIVIKHKFEKLEFEMALNFLIFLCVVYLKMVTQLLATSTNDSLPKDLVEKAEKLANLWQNSMKTHVKDYWPRVAVDIDNIFLIIEKHEKSS
jgi:hypothetical protein